MENIGDAVAYLAVDALLLNEISQLKYALCSNNYLPVTYALLPYTFYAPVGTGVPCPRHAPVLR